MFVSVIVCVYNEQEQLENCLRSLLSQSYDPREYELVVVDDESQDASPKIALRVLREHGGPPGWQYVRIAHGGLAVARNVGIRYGRGEVFAFIDGDARADRDWLRELVRPFGERRSTGLVGGRVELLNRHSRVAEFAHLVRHQQLFGPECYENAFIGCNMAVRRRVFEQAGGFYEDFVSRGDEVSLFLRALPHFDYAPAPEAVVWHARPTSLMELIRTDWAEATLSVLVERVGTRARLRLRLRRMGHGSETALVTLFPVLGATALIHLTPWSIGLAAAGFAAMVRRLLLRQAGRYRLSRLTRRYGLACGLAAHVCATYLRATVQMLGRCVGRVWYTRRVLTPPFTSQTRVLRHERDPETASAGTAFEEAVTG